MSPGREKQFDKKLWFRVNLLGTSYDYSSIMHYAANAFAINQRVPTIIPRDPKMKDIIGKRNTMSPIDIERVQILYKCLRPVSFLSRRLLRSIRNYRPYPFSGNSIKTLKQ